MDYENQSLKQGAVDQELHFACCDWVKEEAEKTRRSRSKWGYFFRCTLYAID
jgi:hypothetical protein